MELDGPYDGLIGFSLGCSLGASWLIRELTLRPHEPLSIKCAIFFSGIRPVDTIALDRGEICFLEPPADGSPLLRGFPTAHIWARNDHWAEGSEKLCSMCDQSERTVFLHGEGHSVPGARAKDALLGSVQAIRRTVAKATTAW